MYTVIIADDEYELRESLREVIDWEELGFQVIAEAANGMEALELVEELEPDLLLTDIKMPFVSGIELARRAGRIRPAMHIAFLSGYDDFMYAKEAIRYNIISYMVKPLSSEEMTQELLAIKRKMDDRIHQMKSLETQMRQEERAEIMQFSFVTTLCMNEEHDVFNEEEKKAEFEAMAKDAGLDLEKEGNRQYQLFVSRFLDEESNNCTALEHQSFVKTIACRYLNCVCSYINGKIITIVSGTLRDLEKYEEVFTKEIIQSAKKILDRKCIIGASRKIEQLTDTRNAYLEAINAWEYAKEDADNICFITDIDKSTYESHTTEYIRDITIELERRIKMGQGIETFLETIIRKDNHNSSSFLILQILTTIYGVVSGLEDEMAKEELLKELLISNKINLNYSYDEIIRLAVNTSNIIVKQRRHNSEIICEEVLDIIEKEYRNEVLSLSEISERLGVSSGYLSTIIKRTQGKTFVNILTTKRMEMSKEYLLTTSRKIMDIAKDCGYNDYHYFSYCFKKFYGVSPNKIRESSI